MWRALIVLLALATSAGTVPAQDHSGHGSEPAAIALPAICIANAPMLKAAPAHAMPTADSAHTALMAGMYRMNAEMMAGGTASDLDVAFVCSMIPHHRGAIDMARAELDHGDDPWARTLAEQIIAAQEREIAEMLAWLEKQ